MDNATRIIKNRTQAVRRARRPIRKLQPTETSATFCRQADLRDGSCDTDQNPFVNPSVPMTQPRSGPHNAVSPPWEVRDQGAHFCGCFRNGAVRADSSTARGKRSRALFLGRPWLWHKAA